jgi:hypothetical protein
MEEIYISGLGVRFGFQDIRVVLGNKCAGHHNLKTIKINVLVKYTENSFWHIKVSES